MALEPAYRAPDPLPWKALAGPLAQAEDALARLDERLAGSPIRDGWIARTHFTDACASLWLEGELIALEDLVLHDSEMDIRAPTHELVRTHANLRARRRIAAAAPDWALSSAGLARLQGRVQSTQEAAPFSVSTAEDALAAEAACNDVNGKLSSLFADIDAAVARADRMLMIHAAHAAAPQHPRDSLIYDPEDDPGAHLAAWRAAISETRALPPTLAAAIALDAWSALQPCEHRPGLGRLLAAALLRARGKARAHLPCLAVGLKAIARDRRGARDAAERLNALLAAIEAAAAAGLRDHDRWMAARATLSRKLEGHRTTSKLPQLIDYVMTRPLVSAAMIAKELGITTRAAQNLVADLGLREATGRGRYRAWGII